LNLLILFEQNEKGFGDITQHNDFIHMVHGPSVFGVLAFFWLPPPSRPKLSLTRVAYCLCFALLCLVLCCF
jgi:hypothetical protein